MKDWNQEELDDGIARCQQWFRDNQRQADHGVMGGRARGWSGPPSAGPAMTALAFAVLQEVQLTEAGDAEAVREFIVSRQLSDGSFSNNADDVTPSIEATAACWLGLQATGLDANDARVRRAKTWIDSHGGLRATTARWTSDMYMTAVYLIHFGYLDPKALPSIPLSWVLVPGIQEFGGRYIYPGMFLGLQQMGLILAKARKARVPKIIVRKIMEESAKLQNPDGNLNGIIPQTLLYLLARSCAGYDRSDQSIKRAADWIQKSKCQRAAGFEYVVTMSEIWDTGMALRSLILSGVSPDDPMIRGGVNFLFACQKNTRLNDSLHTRGRRTGGFPFQFGNLSGPDTDDTGIALSGLGMFVNAAGESRVLPRLRELAENAAERAIGFLRGMQNDDGGWGAYTQGLPSKPRGPLLVGVPFQWSKPWTFPTQFRQRMLGFGDPATAGLVGRVLEGLGEFDYSVSSPMVEHAIEFMRDQQLPDGSWWGRWMANYLAGTAWGLLGLVAVEADEPEMYRKGVDFLLKYQNPDGGYGETIDTYLHEERAGNGPSMPGLTGVVLSALVRCAPLVGGLVDKSLLDRAIRNATGYLLRTQNSDGSWDNTGWQHVFWAPYYFYVLPMSNCHRPLEGLALTARYLHPELFEEKKKRFEAQARALLRDQVLPTPPVKNQDDQWMKTALRQWRRVGDEEADLVVQAAIEANAHHRVSQAFKDMVKNSDPVPAGLGDDVAQWLGGGAQLPQWVEMEKVEMAQALFQRAGWGVALALFTSSLPQCYAGSDGSRVLIETQGLTEHTRRRILETAQFIFDVLDPDAFTPNGKGFVAIRRIRFIHTMVRYYILLRPSWNLEEWGFPINQEDMAGTIMSFSLLVVDALEEMEVEVSEAEKDAWMHLWAAIGELMGVHPTLQARTYADGAGLMQCIRDDQWAASVHGRTLTEQLVESMADYLPVPHDEGRKLPEALIRQFSGDRCAEVLGLPNHGDIHQLLDDTFDVAGWSHQWNPWAKDSDVTPLQRLAVVMMEAIIGLQRVDKPGLVALPPRLKDLWISQPQPA